jgi:hypothetical protein
VLLTKVPGAQSAHTVQLTELFVVLKRPLTQAVQVRSTSAVPSAAT